MTTSHKQVGMNEIFEAFHQGGKIITINHPIPWREYECGNMKPTLRIT